VVLFALALLGFAIVTPARADDVPPRYLISVTPNFNGSALVAPGPLPGTTYTVSVRNDNNVPMPGLLVEFLFVSAIRTCVGAAHTGVTGTNGTCQIQLRAGGCVNASTPGACRVTANGVEIFQFYKVKSPDNDMHYMSSPNGFVNVADLIAFADEFQGQVPAGCHDYTNDGQTSTADLPFFGNAFKAGLNCTLR
jgi:hypothetical protein